jgi:hypothetical protein
MKKFIYTLISVIFLGIPNFLFAQAVSLISYGIENDKIFVRWKTSDTNKIFSIYRSQVLVSNQNLLTNYATKIGTFKGSTLTYKNDYLYYYDTNPSVGTNHYIVFENNGTNDIIEFASEQNYSLSFVFFIPLPKVNTTFEDFGNVIVSWDKIEGIDGYLVYKVGTNFDGKLENLSPIASLPKEETIFIDAIPKNREFIYIVIPFLKNITNLYYSKEKNSIFITISSQKTPVEFKTPEAKPQEVIPQKFESANTKPQETKPLEVITQESKPSSIQALQTRHIQTNVSYSEPSPTIQSTLKETNKEIGKPMTSQVTNIPYTQVPIVDDSEIRNKIKEVVSLKFTKGKYQSAKKDFEELLSEIEGSGYDELEAEIMIYIARCDYALGNKDKAIKTLFKVRKVLPEEADFWLTRFLVNSR